MEALGQQEEEEGRRVVQRHLLKVERQAERHCRQQVVVCVAGQGADWSAAMNNSQGCGRALRYHGGHK